LCITDDPRLASVGGIGMLALVVPTASRGQALAHGSVLVRPPVSVQVLLSGRLRPFVCARDVALELVRRGLGDVVRRVEESRGAPVVLEFAGQTVSQALLGGDGGATLRDLVAAATLLKSKRVPSRLDFLLAAPSRQMLEVLASTGALTDLIATGARLVEPDARVVSGELYAPPAGGVAMRTCDPEPHVAGRRSPIVASAETLAYAVATGEVGDPRTFKRPVRVTVPRALPTDDVLIARKAMRGETSHARSPKREEGHAHAAPPLSVQPWTAAQTLLLVEGTTLAGSDLGEPSAESRNDKSDTKKPRVAVLCSSLDEVREVAGRAVEMAPHVGAVLAAYIPSALVALLSATGLRGQKTLALPAPSQWPERGAATIAVGLAKLPLTWLALGAERAWATGNAIEAGVAAASGRDGRLRSSEGR